jgi:two-component system cell cycle sensor histidine kinase/response regulator CckA
MKKVLGCRRTIHALVGLISAIAIHAIRAEKALRQSKEHYRSLFGVLPVGFYRITPKGQILEVNSALARMMGFEDPKEMRRRNANEYMEREGRRQWLEAVERADGVLSIEVQWLRKDGTPIWVRETAQAIRDADGRLLYLEGAVEDISERKRLEAQYLHAQRMEAVGRLAGGVAHDFNNWLAVIAAYSGLLAKHSDGKVAVWAEEIAKATDQAALLTEQLLTFSRKQVTWPQVLGLNEVLARMDKILRRLIGEDIELTVNPGADLWPVLIDPLQLQQVVMNLVVNARDAMPEGGQLTIEMTNAFLDDGPYVRFTVRDTGVGMDEETQTHIFEPFFTTKDPGIGTGLGLATVHGIVYQNDGHIDVHSTPGQGTTFEVYLPRTDVAAGTADELQQGTGPLPKGGSGTILLAEDNRMLRRALTEVLTRAGYTVLTAGGAGEALSLSDAHPGPIHLLITDVVMPGTSGPRLADRLASQHSEMKVIYISGFPDEALARYALVPDIPLLTKPLSVDHLLAKVREVLVSASD